MTRRLGIPEAVLAVCLAVSAIIILVVIHREMGLGSMIVVLCNYLGWAVLAARLFRKKWKDIAAGG